MMSSGWNLPHREITPEPVAISRRRWLKRAGLITMGSTAAAAAAWWRFRPGSDEEVLATSPEAQPGILQYPAPLNQKFASMDRELTTPPAAARFCNFYEFSTLKDVWRQVDSFHTNPWTLEVSGMVGKPRTFDIDDLIGLFPLEERLYRLRCVETWAMAVPWTGFPLSALLKLAEPHAGARFVRFISFLNPREAARQKDRSLPWPYSEGLTLAEATNPLTILATGMYGKPLLKQNGAPIRLVVPWKYGFKSAKSIVRIELTDRRPATFWNTVASHEYAFEANVDPRIPHPRWSQSHEWMLGTGERRPTQLYNGYGEWVGGLYSS